MQTAFANIYEKWTVQQKLTELDGGLQYFSISWHSSAFTGLTLAEKRTGSFTSWVFKDEQLLWV